MNTEKLLDERKDVKKIFVENLYNKYNQLVLGNKKLMIHL